nr:MAG TPA: hypothetical protein [Caudoviricetes sp.]
MAFRNVFPHCLIIFPQCTATLHTHSLRSATPALRHIVEYFNVSIHALLAECDKCFIITWIA